MTFVFFSSKRFKVYADVGQISRKVNVNSSYSIFLVTVIIMWFIGFWNNVIKYTSQEDSCIYS